MTHGLFDKRGELFKRYFNKGLPFDDYLLTGSSSQLERWKNYQNLLKLNDEQKKLVASFTRQINVLVLSGIWCGDCMRQGPMIRAIEEASKSVKCRFIDNQEHPELRDELRICGGERVPVAVFLSEDFFEVMRYGDRPLSVYRRKAKSELGPACETGLVPPSGTELSAELSEWVEAFEKVHLMLRLSSFLRGRYGD